MYVIGDFSTTHLQTKMKKLGIDFSNVLMDRYKNFVPYILDKDKKIFPELLFLDPTGVITRIPKVGVYLNAEMIQGWVEKTKYGKP